MKFNISFDIELGDISEEQAAEYASDLFLVDTVVSLSQHISKRLLVKEQDEIKQKLIPWYNKKISIIKSAKNLKAVRKT